MKIAIQTLGCKVNQSESASLEGLLRNNKFEIVKYSDNPDVCIINTCTVTAKSDYQSRQLIRKAARSGAKVIATGCYAQLRPDELSKIEGLSFIIGNSGKDNLIPYLSALSDNCTISDESNNCRISISPPDGPLNYQPYYSSKSRALLKIQDGCNFSCTYCTVPLARGRSRSLSKADIIAAANMLVSDGYKEIVITGIHIGSYGLDLSPKTTLSYIVKCLADHFPQIRIRLSSIEPQEFNNELLKLIEDGSVCPHLHIPVQSGSDNILKAMNRGYNTEYFKQIINNIITSCPDISIGTDLVIGFPGESDKDFYDTVNLINMLPLSYLHVFPYSKRPNTRASLFTDQIKGKIKRERVNTIIGIGNIKKMNYITSNIGRILDVIVEGKDDTNRYYKAISDNYLRLFVTSDNMNAGENHKVRVISLTDIGLIAEPLK